MIVEDGTGIANSNSYCSEADFSTYCDDRGITPSDGDAEAALIRATQWLDFTYGARFPGYQTKGRAQGLQWPRVYAYDRSSNARSYAYDQSGNEHAIDRFGFLVGYVGNFGNPIPSNEIPVEIIRATCEAALRELTEASSLAPDLDRGGEIKSLQAGSVSIVYGSNASAKTTFQIIDGILSTLIGKSNSISGTAVRG